MPSTSIQALPNGMDAATVQLASLTECSVPKALSTDRLIWGPRTLTRADLTLDGTYTVPGSGRPLPSYVVPPQYIVAGLSDPAIRSISGLAGSCDFVTADHITTLVHKPSVDHTTIQSPEAGFGTPDCRSAASGRLHRALWATAPEFTPSSSGAGGSIVGRRNAQRNLSSPWRAVTMGSVAPVTTADSNNANQHSFDQQHGLHVTRTGYTIGNNGTFTPEPRRVLSAPQAGATGENSNYRGDPTIANNMSANIPNAENCSTFWVNLPPICTYQMLLGSIKGVGKVSHSSITRPSGKHLTSSAKIEFFDRASVDRLFEQWTLGQISVGTYKPMIVLNRIRVAAKPSNITRVLKLSGHPAITNEAYLTSLFVRNHLRFDLEEVLVMPQVGNTATVELRFASCRAQACRARRIIEGSHPQLNVAYAPDPCA